MSVSTKEFELFPSGRANLLFAVHADQWPSRSIGSGGVVTRKEKGSL